MSWVDVRERWRDSPLRAFSLLTVRAAISSARSSDRPCPFWLALMCSYWRARLVPFLTPRGGIADLLRFVSYRLPDYPHRMRETIGPPLRAAAFIAFIVGLVLLFLNPPSFAGLGDLIAVLAAALAIILVTAWVTVAL